MDMAEPTDLSEELDDDSLFCGYEEILDGTAGRREAVASVNQDVAEREDYWRRAHLRGEIVPRDLQDSAWHR